MTRTKPAGQRLSDPKDPAIRAALAIECPKCGAAPGERCHTTANAIAKHRPLITRLVHYARCQFKPNPAGSKTGADLT